MAFNYDNYLRLGEGLAKILGGVGGIGWVGLGGYYLKGLFN